MMGLAIIYSRTNDGIDAPLVSVEVNISGGLPKLFIVGLPDAAVRESRDRVWAAIVNSKFNFPRTRVTVNLAPADLPKDGGRLDLPIAIGILAASRQIPLAGLEQYEFVGELSLGGQLRAVKGILPTAFAAQRAGRALVIPKDNAAEGSLIQNLNVYASESLLQITSHLRNMEIIQPVINNIVTIQPDYHVDMREVKGQFHAKRALEIAAAGGHNLLMIGPPGTGKTMLATRLATILPPMTEQEALESATVASISNQGFDVKNWRIRPVRDPHHTSSGVALVGGGSNVRPGEISLAHHGILFLDELTEFNRKVLEVLREPLETGRITISRAARQATYPAKFQLIAAMNPCPQGYDCDFRANCRCTPKQQQRYLNRLSAPFLDRIDLQIEVLRLSREDLQAPATGETSEVVRQRVLVAREIQQQRQNKANRFLNNQEIEDYCKLTPEDENLLAIAMDRFKLSARAYHRILKVARTIADLNQCEILTTAHLTESLSYRSMDRLMRTNQPM